jgi:hypothetical protein
MWTIAGHEAIHPHSRPVPIPGLRAPRPPRPPIGQQGAPARPSVAVHGIHGNMPVMMD